MLSLLKSRRGVSGLEYMAIIVLVMTGILLGGPYVMRAINAPFKTIEEGAIDSAREEIKQGSGVVGPMPVCNCTPLAFAGCGDGSGGCAKTRELWRRTCAPLGCEVDLIAVGVITVMQECRDNPSNTCCLDPAPTGLCGALATHVACAAGEMEVKKMCGSPAQTAVYDCLPDAACSNTCQPYGANVAGWCDPLNFQNGVTGSTPPVLVDNGHCNDTTDMRCKAECAAGAYAAGGACFLVCSGPPPYTCPNGVCQASLGENAVNCPADCSGGGGGGGGGCFTAGTKILLENGKEVPIEEIKVNDVVAGLNRPNKVLELLKVQHDSGVIYSFNGGSYFFTDNHPFQTTDGWKSLNPEVTMKEIPELTVGTLNVGDVLITKNGNVAIKSIEKKVTDIHEVYNLSLDGEQVYYANGYLVHNKIIIIEP